MSIVIKSPLSLLSSSQYIRCASVARTLLNPLPQTRSEIRIRAGRWSLLTLRRTFVYLINTQGLTLVEGDQLSPLFKILGTKGVESQLEKLIQDGSTQLQREQALAALFHSPRGVQCFESLSGAQRIELSGPWVRPMMRLAHRELFPRLAIAALYKSTSESDRDVLINQFEVCRVVLGVRVDQVYEVLLPLLPLQDLKHLLWKIADVSTLKQLQPLLKYLSPKAQQLYHTTLCELSLKSEAS